MSFHNQLKEKIVSQDQALKELKTWREKNKKIVFTNGCFDIIHPGHIDYLSQARDLGDILVLGVSAIILFLVVSSLIFSRILFN